MRFPAFPHCLEAVVVAAAPFEVRAGVEKGLREQPLLYQQEDDEEATKPAIAIEEGVDRLETGDGSARS